MKTTLLTISIEEDLLVKATKIFDRLGYTLEEAIILFLKKTIEVNGLPFKVSEEELNLARGLSSIRKMQEHAEKNGLSNMTLEEIYEEIKAARAERHKKDK